MVYDGFVACGECTSLCHLLHWVNDDLYPRVTRFFKVMIGQDWNKVLFLPPKFSAHVIDLVGEETELEDVNGDVWRVTLSSSTDGLAFRSGWQAFASDHNLTMGDILVFNYIRQSHFVVHIFGRTGCEKFRIGQQFEGIQPEDDVSTQAKPCENINMDAIHRQTSSTMVASGSKSQPPATNRTQDSGGGNVKSPCLDNSISLMLRQDGPSRGDLSGFEVHESNQTSNGKEGIEAGAGNSNLAHAVMRSQAEANKDFIGTENLNLNIFTKETDVIMIEKEKVLEFKDDGTRKCYEPLATLSNSLPLGPSCGEPGREGNDWSSPRANENGGQKFAEAGDINKMVKKEKEETSGQAHSRAKGKRGLQPSPHVDTVRKQVKLEPLEVPSSYMAAVTCLAVTDGQHFLELPAKFLDVKLRKGEMESKAVVLKDPERRLWPALYHQRSDMHVLITHWDIFNQKNGIRTGDRYVFEVEDESQSIYRIDVLRQ